MNVDSPSSEMAETSSGGLAVLMQKMRAELATLAEMLSQQAREQMATLQVQL